MRLVYSNYDKESGKSTVLMEHEGKQYMGNAYFNKEEEKCPPNAFFGLRIAEKRAIIEYFKEKKAINKIKQQALESFKKDLDTYVYDGVLEEGLYETILKKLDEHIKYYGKTSKHYKDTIETQRKNIIEEVKLRQQFLKKHLGQ